MELIKEVKAINAKISSIAKRGASLDADIQLAACSVLAHIDQHGDVTLADRLVNAMPKSGRKLALVEFMLAFGKLAVLKANSKENKAAIESGRVFAYAKDKDTDIEGAIAKPWYEFKKEAAVSEAFDVQASVKAILTRMAKAAKEGKRIDHKEEAIAEVQALLAALQA